MKTWQRNVVAASSVVMVLGLVAIWSANTEPALAQGNGATKLNCDNPPCDAVARGRAAFNDRNLND